MSHICSLSPTPDSPHRSQPAAYSSELTSSLYGSVTASCAAQTGSEHVSTDDERTDFWVYCDQIVLVRITIMRDEHVFVNTSMIVFNLYQ